MGDDDKLPQIYDAITFSSGKPLLLLLEAFGARLYTGPMFVKYNAVLRGNPSLARCKGNGYRTTIHVINSCIVKASKLTRANVSTLASNRRLCLLGCCSAAARPLLGCCSAAARLLLGHVE